ncbi:MAG: hypothetical protein IIA83_03850 [Thaumarchaeota archaeon]|nr:hypothetical protein [Nitrososphaerota archaeon]
MKRFSDRFPTFFDWEKQAGNSGYAKRVKQLHYWYPNATLPQLSGKKSLPSKKLPIHLIDPRGLKAKQRVTRNDALSVLNKIRRGETPFDIIDEIGISKNNLLKHLGNNIKIKKNQVKATKSDQIPREMIISESGVEDSIIVKNLRDASIIGRYQNAKRHFLETGDSSKLKEFKKIKLKDTDGTIHKLETNPNKIIEIEDRKEEPEAFEIYKS